MQLQEALERYETQLAADGRSRHTRMQAARHVRAFDAWLVREQRSRELARIDHETVALFLASPAARTTPMGRPKKASSVNALRTSLRCFGAYVARAGLVDRDPCRLTRLARTSPPPPRGLSDDDRRRLLAALEHAATFEERRDRALIRVMLEAGLRVSGALGLDVEDVDLVRGELRIRQQKGGGEAVALVPPGLVADLAEFVGTRRHGPLFTTKAGRRITARHAHRRLQLWLGRSGVDRGYGCHALRHAFAQRLLARTADISLVSRALCHASIASTTVYARCSTDRLREALGGG